MYIYMYTASFYFLKAVPSFTISLSFPYASVLDTYCPCIQDSLPLTEVEAVFDTSISSIGDRDCRIQRVSALKG